MTMFVTSWQARASVTRNPYGVDTTCEYISGSEGRLINLNYEYDMLLNISILRSQPYHHQQCRKLSGAGPSVDGVWN